MAIRFQEALAQHFLIPGPRPELNGVGTATLLCWIRLDPSSFPLAAGARPWVMFANGTTLGSKRFGASVDGGFPGFVFMAQHAQKVSDANPQGDAVTVVNMPPTNPSNEFGQGGNVAYFVEIDLASTGSARIHGGPADGVSGGSNSTGGGAYNGALPANSSLGAAIGSLADGLGPHFEGELEDLRLYSRKLTFIEQIELVYREGNDRGHDLDSTLLMRWPMQGVGVAGNQVDTIGGVVATAVNAPVYSNMGKRNRKRNRSG